MQKRKKIWAKRPPEVTIVGWGIVVLFLINLYLVLEPWVRMQILREGLQGPLIVGTRLTALGQDVALSGIYLLLVIIGIIVLIAFMRLHRRAWVILMAWTGISLTIALINFFNGHPNYLVMLSNTIIAFGLNQPEVQHIFRIRTDEGDHAR